jgi:hypothetical protein
VTTTFKPAQGAVQGVVAVVIDFDVDVHVDGHQRFDVEPGFIRHGSSFLRCGQ